MWDEIYLMLPSRLWEILEEAQNFMKQILADQKARIALNNHLAQIKYANKFPKNQIPQYRAVHIYYPIRATKCNRLESGRDYRCFHSTEKKYGKRNKSSYKGIA